MGMKNGRYKKLVVDLASWESRYHINLGWTRELNALLEVVCSLHVQIYHSMMMFGIEIARPSVSC